MLSLTPLLVYCNKEALTSINVEENNIPAAQEEEICQSVRMNKLRVALRDEALTELDVSGIGFGAEGAKVVAQYVSDNQALLHFDISKNNIGEAGTRLLAVALKGNMTMTQLNISSNNMTCNTTPGAENMAGVAALADAISGMGAMTSLNLASNSLGAAGAKIVAEALKVIKWTPAVILVSFFSSI
jgi:Ran GTPase-activating protein (RanGAP) involved in mRNA processing and transport